uniref:AXH domain-containing protein n=1 Tax=Timema douglasi TaxID=61478 RepID=A0A7R8W051_TIMDO|nr:unnamed protein product [Timema douglasi]
MYSVELESRLDHPFFVYGQGWASCLPERSLQSYGLQCHRLQVGDICISLSPRPSAASVSPNATASSRKRRWSAPDHFLEGAETPPCSTTSVSAPPPLRRPRE